MVVCKFNVPGVASATAWFLGYLEARDLPSRGLYPFMRTLFCNVGSRCRSTSYTAQRHGRFG